MLQSYTTAGQASTPKIRRIRCPVHGGTERNVSLGNGWAKCHSRGCSSKDILAALGEAPATHWTPPPPRPRPALSVIPLPPVSSTQGLDYLQGIGTPNGASILYQRDTGEVGRHWRNTNKRRNPGVKGDGWQLRRFNPERPDAAPAIALAEGEKDAAVLALAGLVAFCAPRGAQSLPSADMSELVELARATGLPVLLAGDHDNAGHDAMLKVRESLRKAGLVPLDTMIHAPLKGSIADLPHRDLLALVDLLTTDSRSRWRKPRRDVKKHPEFKCLHPATWLGQGADLEGEYKLRPCGNTTTCTGCEAWELYLHVERAWRGRPQQLLIVPGFGDADSTTTETFGAAKEWRERWEGRIRKNSCVHPINQERIKGERRNFLTALFRGDDYRAGVAMLVSVPFTDEELARERKLAKKAGKEIVVIDRPTRKDIEAVAPTSLTVNMEWQDNDNLMELAKGILKMAGHLWEKAVKLARRLMWIVAKRTDKTNTWTSGNWPTWNTKDSTYAFSDGEELQEDEELPKGVITQKQWLKDHGQEWREDLTDQENLIRREDHALYNAQLWVSGCQTINMETLRGIGDAARRKNVAEAKGLVKECYDYFGPSRLLRDVAAYLDGRKGWRKAFGPVLAVAGWRE